jgi:hypothetical protein
MKPTLLDFSLNLLGASLIVGLLFLVILLIRRVIRSKQPSVVKVLKFFRTWNEVLTLPIALALWYFSPVILRSFDPTAAVYDAGVFQIILFGVIKFLIASFFAWLTIKLQWPKLYRMLDEFDLSLNSAYSPNAKITFTNKKALIAWFGKLFLVFATYSVYLLGLLYAMDSA